MHSKKSDFFKRKPQQAGFSLIELLVAMLISLTLIFACTALYSSLKSSIQTAQKLATAQESLRGAFFLMSRSVHQAKEIKGSGASGGDRFTEFTTTYGETPTGEKIYSCLGNYRNEGDTDFFSSDGAGLYCDDGSGSQLIALNIEELTFIPYSGLNGDGGLFNLKIAGMPEYLGDKKLAEDGLSFSLALRQKILLELTE